MSFWRTYYHLIWATQSRQPLITRDREAELHGYMNGYGVLTLGSKQLDEARA